MSIEAVQTISKSDRAATERVLGQSPADLEARSRGLAIDNDALQDRNRTLERENRALDAERHALRDDNEKLRDRNAKLEPQRNGPQFDVCEDVKWDTRPPRWSWCEPDDKRSKCSVPEKIWTRCG
ncbi:MAG: hypothetical protein AAF799_48525 [Myxococcota bacterium]